MVDSRTISPLRDDRDPVADLLDLVEEVAGEEDGLAAVDGEAPDEGAHLLDTGRVEAVHRLVEDDEVGIAEQGRGDSEALPHAGRIAFDLALRIPGQPDLIEQPVDPLCALALGLRQHLEIAAAGEEGIEVAAVDQRADPAKDRGIGAQVLAEQPRLARGRSDQADQHPDRRRLAGAVGPEEAVDLSRTDREGDVAHRPHSAAPSPVGLAEAGELEDGFVGHGVLVN